MLKIEPNEDRDKAYHLSFCTLPFTKLILNSWGQVSMCCHQLTQLGELTKDTNLIDLWNSPVAKEIRATSCKGELHPVCTSWNSCPFIVKEKTMMPIAAYKNAAYPIYIEICLPDKHCNIGGEKPSDKNPACIMCRRNFHVPDQPDLTDLFCEKVKPLMPYLRYLCVLGIAEPFWKDATFRILELVEFFRYKQNICFTTNTNGTCLTEKTTQRFFDEVNLSDISWSIDSATRETHKKIRRLDAFDFVCKNLRRWMDLREQHGGSKNHKVCIYNNINMLNVYEMTLMVEMASEFGVDKMIMLPTYDQAGVVKLGDLMLCETNKHIFEEQSNKAMDRAKQLGLDLQYTKSFTEIPPVVNKKLSFVQILP